MHLQGTVAATKGYAPVAVAQQLDLVMAGLLNVQLDEDVFIIANAVGFDLIENLPYQSRSLRCSGSNSLVVGFFQRQQRCARIRCPLPPPPPMALRRIRLWGYFLNISATSA